MDGLSQLKAKGESEEVCESHDLDGLSREELVAPKTNQSDTGEPANAQAEANDQAEAWDEHWGSKMERPENIVRPSDMGARPPS